MMSKIGDIIRNTINETIGNEDFSKLSVEAKKEVAIEVTKKLTSKLTPLVGFFKAKRIEDRAIQKWEEIFGGGEN
jgi:hypothetical protein